MTAVSALAAPPARTDYGHASGTEPGAKPAAATASGASSPAHAQAVQFVKTFCIDCHNAEKMKGEWDATLRELNQVTADLQRLTVDQDRIRKNLRETPEKAEVYATYLKKLSDQEKELDALTATQKSLMADEFKAKKGYEEYLGGLSE